MSWGDKKKKNIRAYAKNAVRQMLKWAQKKYKLSDKVLNDPKIIISFDKRRQYSYGGWLKNRNGEWRPYINLSLNTCLKFKPQTQTEYTWYADDPVIGKKWATTWKFWTRFEAGHEVAHVIELAPLYLKNRKQKTELRKRFGRSKLSDDHTKTFQKIYRIIRRKFVNGIRTIK
jgi:hypothetical protein